MNTSSTSNFTTNTIVQGVSDNARVFEISENYFSNILNAQLTIFSLIVGALIALYFLFNYKVNKEQIRETTKQAKNEIREEMQKEFNAFKEGINKEFEIKSASYSDDLKIEIDKHSLDITGLRGQIFRTLGQFWLSQKQYSASFIWWIRAAENFAKIEDERLTRISLGFAKEAVEKINFGYELTPDNIGEYQNTIIKLPTSYQIEKDLLDKVIKETLQKKFKPQIIE